MHNDVLLTIWRQLCKDPKAIEFVKYLFKDLLQNQFMLESISSRVVVDSDLLELINQIEEPSLNKKKSDDMKHTRKLSIDEVSEFFKKNSKSDCPTEIQSVRRSSFTFTEQSTASVNRVKNRLANLI